MTYPLSSIVNVGDATEASQYNNLRTDALYMGADPTASGTVRDLLMMQMTAMELDRISATTIQLTASESAPASVVIAGQIYTVTAGMTLLITSYDCPTKGRYFLYATPGTGGRFTLGAGATAPADSRVIGTFLWSGTGLIPGTVQDIRTYEMNRAGRDQKRASGRLTLASGTPVPDTDITVAGTVYFTPYEGNEIGLKIGNDWELFEFTELSESLAGLQHEIPYDIFLTADETGLHLVLEAWGSASARLTAIAYADGVPVSVADAGRRYLGSVAVDSSGYAQDSQTARTLWNRNNQVPRTLTAKLPDSALTSHVENTWAPYFSNNAPQVYALVPDPETVFELNGIGISSYITATDAGYSRGFVLGIGQDMEMAAPYSGNDNCVPVYLASYGNAPIMVTMYNSQQRIRGYHRYTLCYYTNSSFNPGGQTLRTICDEHPGLFGYIMG